MSLKFVNRVREMAELDAAARKGGLLVIFGRRRVGKSRLLRKWLEDRGGMYSQAVEGPVEMQIQQLMADIRTQLGSQIVPRSWPEFLEVLSLQKKPWILCLDELPYLTAVDASLPSQLQEWLDHSIPRGCLLILAGSSTAMMNELFLNRTAPLYGRAQKLINVRPMDYAAFCEACGQKPGAVESFEKFSLVGGVPKYWEFVEKEQSPAELAEVLYFDFAPYMEQEPQRILRDEGVNGANALSVLEAIGRGAERPSEIAQKLSVPQTNLSRIFEQLLDASVLVRELPFGESVRTTKKTLYRIQDPTIRFWFRVYSPHRSRWMNYTAEERGLLVHDHASSVFEDVCRARFPGASRYWEKDVEFDLVAEDPENPKSLIVAEVKWRKVNAAERRSLLATLEKKWERSALGRSRPKVRFEVMDASVIKT